VLDQRGRTLFDALWAFYQEHEYCGALGGVEVTASGWRVRAARRSTETLTVTD
jgi:hypothetical protein